tara:strand:+ start:579 stop:1061 length:483 start_codon:yes stop_codon:yes gene_type:complete
MADGGASEMLMLITGLITAGIAASVLIASWGGIANSIESSKMQVEADTMTKASLTSDPMDMAWNQTACNLTIHIQNSGKLVLKNDEIGVIVNGSETSISGRRMLTSTTDWVQGQVLELRICPIGLVFNPGDETVLTVIVRSEEYRGVSGTYAFSEVIRFG